MVTGFTYNSPAAAWRQGAQVVMARAAKYKSPNLAEAQQDYATARLAELIEREMARAPKLRPEQVAAIRAIVAGADLSMTLADAVTARPASSAA